MEDEKVSWRSVILAGGYVLWSCFIASRLPSFMPGTLNEIFWVAIVMISHIGAVLYCMRGCDRRFREQKSELEQELNRVRQERSQLILSQPKLIFEQCRIHDELKHVLFLLHSDTPECREVRRHVSVVVNRLSEPLT